MAMDPFGSGSGDEYGRDIRELYAPSTDRLLDPEFRNPGYRSGPHPPDPGYGSDVIGLPYERNRRVYMGDVMNPGAGADGGDMGMGDFMKTWDRTAPGIRLPGIESFQYADFVAPTLDTTNDPGYAFRLKQGLDTIQNAASAQGIRGGDVAKAFNQYSQDYASSEYDKVYGRAYQQYIDDRDREYAAYLSGIENSLSAAQIGYQADLSSYMADYNAFRNNQMDRFGRLATLMGFGQNSLDSLSQLGAGFANSNANLWGQQGAASGGAALARGNAWGNVMPNLGGLPLSFLLMSGGGGGMAPGAGDASTQGGSWYDDYRSDPFSSPNMQPQ